MAFEDMRDKHVPPTFEQMVAATDPKFVRSFGEVYSLDKPHPGYGTDPNIINYLGHTLYPKWITKPNGEKVIVKDKAEEDALLGSATPEHLREDGPTISEYVAAGYDPKNYPPKGYASKSSEEEIKTFIDKHNKSGW